MCKKIGYPKTIRVDQGSEFISRNLDLWAYTNGGTLDFSRPAILTEPEKSTFRRPKVRVRTITSQC